MQLFANPVNPRKTLMKIRLDTRETWKGTTRQWKITAKTQDVRPARTSRAEAMTFHPHNFQRHLYITPKRAVYSFTSAYSYFQQYQSVCTRIWIPLALTSQLSFGVRIYGGDLQTYLEFKYVNFCCFFFLLLVVQVQFPGSHQY